MVVGAAGAGAAGAVAAGRVRAARRGPLRAAADASPA